MNYKSINNQLYIAADKLNEHHKLLIKLQDKTYSSDIQHFVGCITEIKDNHLISFNASFNKHIYPITIDLDITEMLIIDIDEIL